MRLQIITPEKTLIDADAQMVTIPGTEGDFGVLAGHAPFISTIREGIIAVDFENGEKKEFPIQRYCRGNPGKMRGAGKRHCSVIAYGLR